jgi:hypothetical protein
METKEKVIGDYIKHCIFHFIKVNAIARGSRRIKCKCVSQKAQKTRKNALVLMKWFGLAHLLGYRN